MHIIDRAYCKLKHTFDCATHDELNFFQTFTGFGTSICWHRRLIDQIWRIRHLKGQSTIDHLIRFIFKILYQDFSSA